MDAVDRLRERAQNEQTVLALNALCKQLEAENARLKEELAAAQKDAERKIETAWRDGYGSRVTYNDHEVSDEATCWIESTTFAAIAAEKGEKK